MTDARPTVAIDGPASSGKSSVGAAAARELGYRFCDTGLLYRALTGLALKSGVDLSDPDGLVPLVAQVELASDGDGRLSRVMVDGVDVTADVRGPAVDRSVSEVARVPEVRAALLERQRALAADGGIVMAGRDIGTVVLPDADLKVFLDASAEERARRRAEERGLEPDSPEADEILADLRRRDDLDRNRAVAPLRAAADATVIATDGNTFDQTVAAVIGAIRATEARRTEAAARGERGAASAPTPTPAPAPVPGKARPKPLGDGRTWFIRATDVFGRIVWRLFARVHLSGFEHLRGLDGPVLIVANHISNADPPLIGSFVTPALDRRIYWLGKQEALDWPVLGALIEHNAVIGIQRGAADVDAFRSAKRVLDEGHVLIVFPEGTRSPTGKLQEAKEGTTILALRTGARLVPIGVSGTRGVWPRGQTLPHPIRGRVSLTVGRPFTVSAPGAGAERRAAQVAATTEIMRRIAELLPPEQRGFYADAVTRTGGAGRVGRGPRAIIEAMGTVRDVRIAKRTGFCYGVREAIDKAKESAAAGKATHTLGQVVHNEGVIRDLEEIGVETVESLDDVDHGAAVVIRAHGVRPEVMERAEARGLEVIDGTCTWVIQEQRELVRLVEEGYTIVLLGTPKHPEVVGLLGFAPDAIVVDEEGDWGLIPRRKKMALISQSTQPPWKFEKLAGFMVSRSHELKIVNTVCPVTIRRQEDTLETAREVDLMVVVGGRSSANTKELTRLCEIAGTHAIQIESVSDLEDASVFGSAAIVGVTGGTSTPIEDLQAVAERILRLAGTDEAAAGAHDLAMAALLAAATPAGRTTSLPAREPGSTSTAGAA